jgi:hypothetical protein
MSALSATLNFITSASGVPRPGKRPFPSSEPHVRPTRTQSGSSRAHRGASSPAPSAAPRRSERASLWRQPHAHLRPLQVDEPQDDFAVALAGSAHGPHAVDHRRLDLDEALAPIALSEPLRCALGQCRGDGVVGASSVARSGDVRPRWNFWSLGPFVVVRGGHRGCEHSGKLT